MTELSSLGYQCEQFGNDALLVRSIPAALVERQPLRVLNDTLDRARPSTRARPTGDSSSRCRLACHSAVRAGDTLEPAEMQTLVQQLGEDGDLRRLRPRAAHGDPDEP